MLYEVITGPGPIHQPAVPGFRFEVSPSGRFRYRRLPEWSGVHARIRERNRERLRMAAARRDRHGRWRTGLRFAALALVALAFFAAARMVFGPGKSSSARNQVREAS